MSDSVPEAPPAAQPAPFLSLRGVSKRLGRTEALRAIDLDAGSDELLVVLGPTGAGKTTLLRTIAGLERPDHGAIVMAGRDVTALDPASRDIALVFQNFSLYPRWSVRKNLEFPLRAPGRNIAEEEDPAPHRLGGRSPPHHPLSGSRGVAPVGRRDAAGGIGRAIVRRPRLFLMDEPLTNLDAKLREALRVELVELRRELKTPMVFVTHDQAEALSMADRIVVLSEGRILQTGVPREIYERPASPVVALQLGQPAINLLPVRRDGGQWRAADGTPILRADGAGPSKRLLGIRPEHVALLGGEASSEGSSASSSTPGPRRPWWSIGSGRGSTSWSRAARTCGRGTACTRASRRCTPFFSIQRRRLGAGKQGDAMTARSFEPKFMKISVLTAALQELTPREIRDEDPDRAIEDWLEFARELGCPQHPALGGAPPDRGGRAARGDARSGRQHPGPAQAVRQGARQARARPR